MRTRWTCVLALAAWCGLPVSAGAQVTAWAVVPTWTNARVTILDAFTGTTVVSLIMNGGAHVVSKIDTATYAVFPPLLSSRYPWGIAVAPNGDKTYIVNRATSTRGVLDNGSYTISGAVPVDREPVAGGFRISYRGGASGRDVVLTAF